MVDACDETERVTGWHCYLEEKLRFPFKARCINLRPISPLKKNEQVLVEGMASEEECGEEMFVTVLWQKRKLAVPSAQLEGIDVDSDTREAIEDWRYWTVRGYQF